MAITLGAHAIKATAGTGNATTDAFDSSGATLLIMVATAYPESISVSDSKSNTWTALTVQPGNLAYGRLYYVLNPTVGSGHTVTAIGTFASVAVACFNNVDSYDQESAAANTTQPGSITPSDADALIVNGWVMYGSAAPTIDTGTLLDALGSGFGNIMDIALAYEIRSGSAAASNPTWSSSGGCFQATFNPSAGGGGNILSQMLRLGVG